MFTEKSIRQSKCAERTYQLEGLGQGDADFLDGNIIKNVRHCDAGHGRNHENEIYEPAYLHWGRDIPESTSEWKKQGRGDETNETKTPNGTEPGGRTLYQDTIERPTNGGDEGDQQSANSGVPGGSPGLETKIRQWRRVIPARCRLETAIAEECGALLERR